MSDSAQPTGYRLITSGAVLQQLRELSQIAAARGALRRYRGVLIATTAALEATPLTWGDPQFRLSQLGLTVYHRLFDNCSISYAVDEARRVVYLRSVTLPDQFADGHTNGET